MTDEHDYKIKRRDDGRWWVEGPDGMRPATPLEVRQRIQIEQIGEEIADRVGTIARQTYNDAWTQGFEYGRTLERNALASAAEDAADLLERLASGALKSPDAEQRRTLRKLMDALGLGGDR